MAVGVAEKGVLRVGEVELVFDFIALDGGRIEVADGQGQHGESDGVASDGVSDGGSGQIDNLVGKYFFHSVIVIV